MEKKVQNYRNQKDYKKLDDKIFRYRNESQYLNNKPKNISIKKNQERGFKWFFLH